MKKGEETRSNILKTAKSLFYKKGYKKTSMKEIAAAAGIAPGNLTYYFPTKDLLVSEILNNYFMDIKNFAINNIPKSRNAYYKHFYVSLIFNINIFNDKQIASFYHEILEKQSIDYLLHNSIDTVYKDFIKIFNLRITEKQFKYITAADYGARREILLKYFKEETSMPVKDLVIILLTTTSRIFGIKDIDLFRASHEAYIQIDHYQFADIKLLE